MKKTITTIYKYATCPLALTMATVALVLAFGQFLMIISNGCINTPFCS